MISQPGQSAIKLISGIIILSLCLGGCDSGKPGTGTARNLNRQPDSLRQHETDTIAKVPTHPYLKKADEIQDQEGIENAIPYYKAAVSLFEKEGNWEGLVTAGNRISSYYADEGYYNDTYNDSLLQNLESTLELGKKYLDSSNLAISETEYWFGIYFERMNEPYKAIAFLKKALNNRIRQLGNNHLLVAESLKALGDTYLYGLSDYHNAESCYEKSVDIKSRILDSANVDLVRGYYAVASAKRLNDDSESAVNYGLMALKTAMMDPVENRQRIGLCHNILANTYNEKNDYKNAEYHYKKAIEISKANFGENNSDLPVYYNGLGTMYLRKNDLEPAKSYLMHGLNINRMHFSRDSDKITNNLLNLGRVYTRLKKYDSAFLYLNEGLQLKLKEFGMKNVRTALIYEYLGDTYADRDQLQLALQNYQNALIGLVKGFEEDNILTNPKFSSRNYGFRLIHVLIKKAFALKQQYHRSNDIKFLETSLDTYLLASRIIDLKRNNDITEESRLILIENHFQDKMENGIDCAFLLYQLTGQIKFQNIAFQMIEKSKYMLLFESLIKNENNQQFGIPDSLVSLEKNLKVEMAFFKQNLNEEIQNENSDRQRINKLQNQVFATARKQERLYEKLKDKYPNYYDIKFDSVTLSIQEVQKTLKNKETEIMEFYYGDKNVYTLSISDEMVQFKRLEKSQALESALDIYSDQISNPPDITDPAYYQLFCQSAFRIHELLIKPALAGKPRKNLVIIPHGKLSVLPFESIIKSTPPYEKVDYKNLDYLVRDHRFSYAYSANLLFKNRVKMPTGGRPKLLAFSYSSELNNQREEDEIIGTSREISNISKLVNGTYYKGNDATESAFKSAASDFDILHLAVHGVADNESNLSNSLVFKKGSDSVNDGILRSYELLNLNMKAKLVVLSACETGLGKQFKGEGVFSMARSFAYAGCKAIIMSYWKAQDNATAKIMGNFYQNLIDGASIDKALKDAKVTFISEQEELTAHPSAWAAFVALGDVRTPIFQKQNASTNIVWYFAIASLLILVILFAARSFFTKYKSN